MKESEFNKIVKDSIIERGGFAYKISDSAGAYGQKRPFDGFGILKGRNIYWEGKMCNGVKAFNLKDLFEGKRGHQMVTLGQIADLTPEADVWVPLLCYIPRASQIYLFSFRALQDLYGSGVNSIHAAVLNKLQHTVIKSANKTKIIIGDLVPISIKELRLAYTKEEK